MSVSTHTFISSRSFPFPLVLRLASPDWIAFHGALDKVIYQDGTCLLQAPHLCQRHKVTRCVGAEPPVGRTPSACEGHLDVMELPRFHPAIFREEQTVSPCAKHFHLHGSNPSSQPGKEGRHCHHPISENRNSNLERSRGSLPQGSPLARDRAWLCLSPSVPHPGFCPPYPEIYF